MRNMLEDAVDETAKTRTRLLAFRITPEEHYRIRLRAVLEEKAICELLRGELDVILNEDPIAADQGQGSGSGNRKDRKETIK